jgi:hypothetical protein
METELDRELASLRASMALERPPERVDRAIATAIETDRGNARSASRRWRIARPAWLTLSAAVAATFAAVVIVNHSAMRVSPTDAGTAAVAGDADRAWFLPVVPVTELASASDALVVSAQLSRMTLAQLGLPVDPAQAADVVDTELLIRPNGALLAVRFVQ